MSSRHRLFYGLGKGQGQGMRNSHVQRPKRPHGTKKRLGRNVDFRIALAAAGVAIAVAGDAHAAIYTWSATAGTSSGGTVSNWSNGINWVGGAAPTDLSTDNLTFNYSTSKSNKSVVDGAYAPWIVNSLTFNSDAGANPGSFMISAGGGGGLIGEIEFNGARRRSRRTTPRRRQSRITCS